MRRSTSSLSDAGKKQVLAIRSFLVLRRLLHDFQKYAPTVTVEEVSPTRGTTHLRQPWANSSSDETLPVQVEEERFCTFTDNMSLEVGMVDRIVCSLATPQ